MSFNFPNSPSQGATYTPIAGGFTYVFDAGVWKIQTTYVATDAPSDGQKYGRKNGGWSIVLYVGTSAPSSPNVNDLWVDVT